LMRQQMLAFEMERHRDLAADIVSVLHVSPLANEALQVVTAADLRRRYPERPLTSLWPLLVRPRTDKVPRFQSLTTAALFEAIGGKAPASPEGWQAYIRRRYAGALQR
jgi:hypothetical protein